MEVELHRLELRYERLRRRDPRRERQLIASLADVGQQIPIVVIGGEDERLVVIDGYKRVRALRRLAQDTVRTTRWAIEEREALLLERLMRTSATEGVFEQGWLLRELSIRFCLSQEELARRFDKTQSWVSRRLALVAELPASIQEHVRQGEILAHAAMKCLVPMARANGEAACALAKAIAPLRLSTRQISLLWAGWQAGDEKTRQLILNQPLLYLRAQQQAERDRAEKSPAEQLVGDLDCLSGVVRRVRKRLAQGIWSKLSEAERAEAERCMDQARADSSGLWTRFDKEVTDARREHACGDTEIA